MYFGYIFCQGSGILSTSSVIVQVFCVQFLSENMYLDWMYFDSMSSVGIDTIWLHLLSGYKEFDYIFCQGMCFSLM